MLRNALKSLIAWKQTPNFKPLLVRGARQVGKTTLIEQFGREQFGQDFIKVDFEARPDLRKIFEGPLEPKTIVPQIELAVERQIVDGKTLLFFDEIQECPQALLSLRYFFEQRPTLHVIAAGSLLEFALEKISFPVGRVRTLTIYPMTFFEFLLACGKEQLAALIASEPRTLTPTEHQLALSEYIKYLYVGGLPEAVKVYAETNSYVRAMEVQRDLAHLFEADFGKYVGKASIDSLRQVFRAVPLHLTKPLKYSHLSEDFSVSAIKRSVELLLQAQVIRKVPHANPHGLPLGGSASQKLFKLILVDMGLLHGLSHLPMTENLQPSTLLDAYRGALAEQAVGQALIEQTDGELYTWYRPDPGAQSEVDYLIAQGQTIYPIEVKAGAPGRLKSLHFFLSQFPLAKEGYVISAAPYEKRADSKLTLLPIYYSGTFIRWLTV